METGTVSIHIRSEASKIFKDKTILITGGTGYLGIALTKELLKQKPQSIRLFSRDEVKHHRTQELFGNDPRLRNLIGDVRDYERLHKAMRDADIVIHAAALKRLDMIEYNVEESIKTNILGTLNVVNACLANRVEKAVFVSTDKACSPVNTYGASKFVGERIFIESNYSKGTCPTRFLCVRYGNVLESTGSVIPFFEEKIRNGDKIPLTDERMTRFIITPEQAVKLIFDASETGRGGEVFVPKLPSFRIIDLIDILKSKNRSTNNVEVIGIRPGEKLHEVMINSSEVPRTYQYKGNYIIISQIERYIDDKRPAYFKGRQLTEKDMDEYSSKDNLISRDEAEEFFRSQGLM